MEQHEKLDYFDPLFVILGLIAVISDFSFLFIIGVAIPVVGLVIAAGIIILHYLAGVILLGGVLFKLKHLVPKLILGIGILLPLPLLTLALGLAIVAQNRFVELVLTQATLAVVTGGAGNVAAGAAEVGQGAAVATRGVEAAGALAKGAEEAGQLVRAESATQKTVGARGRLEQGLRKRVSDLEEELGIEGEREDGGVSEENFGIIENTDKMGELFSPDFEMEEELKKEKEAKLELRKRFEERLAEEIEERRNREGNIPEISSDNPSSDRNLGVDEVELNDDENEVNLRKEA